jgi:hypothetical protein
MTLGLPDFLDTDAGSVDVVYNLDKPPWIGSVHLDATISETIQESGEATIHPVEDGSDISDHYRSNPRTIQIVGEITNTPVRVPLSQPKSGVAFEEKEFTWQGDAGTVDTGPITLPTSGLIGAGLNVVADAIGLTTHRGTARGFSAEFNRCYDAYSELSRIREEGESITVVTAFANETNMVIESIEVSDINSALDTEGVLRVNSISISITAVQITVVSTESVEVEPLPKTNNGKAKSDKGKKSTSETTGAASDKASAAYQIVHG